MLCDARTLEDGHRLATDVCIVGTGPAGIAVSLGLLGSGLSVLMLETGGERRDPALDADRQPEAIAFGSVTAVATTRMLGGNANAWCVRTAAGAHGVRLVPLSPADFERRPWLANSGWPIDADDLAPWLDRATALFGLPDRGFDPAAWAGPGAGPFALAGGALRTGMFLFAPGERFTVDHLRTLGADPAVTVLTHATASEVETTPEARHVTSLAVTVPMGRTLSIRAATYVLAAGGLGTTHLLLSSDRVVPGGLGNQTGHLGRWFMDHPILDGGDLFPASPDLFDAAALYDLRSVDGAPAMAHLRLTDEALRREPVLNLSAILLPRERGDRAGRNTPARHLAGIAAAARIADAVRHRERPHGRDMAIALLGVDGIVGRVVDRVRFPKSTIGRGGWSTEGRRSFDRFQIVHQAEQAPHRDNRVCLGTSRDRSGARRLRIDWRWHETDRAATVRAQALFARSLAAAGIGCFAIAGAGDGPVQLSSSTAHYMGTTRMSADPWDGVVDPWCRVHGVDNLHVASSSTFPTGGFANPTLTVVALALRIADRIRGEAARTHGGDGARHREPERQRTPA